MLKPTIDGNAKAREIRQAAAFRDTRSYPKILSAVSPAEAKRKTHRHCWHLGFILPRVEAVIVRTGLGRAVRGFDEERWERLVCAVAKEVVAQKFAKVEGIAAQLRGTGSRVLAEASETDRIWGIGMRFVRRIFFQECQRIVAGIWIASSKSASEDRADRTIRTARRRPAGEAATCSAGR